MADIVISKAQVSVKQGVSKAGTPWQSLKVTDQITDESFEVRLDPGSMVDQFEKYQPYKVIMACVIVTGRYGTSIKASKVKLEKLA